MTVTTPKDMSLSFLGIEKLAIPVPHSGRMQRSVTMQDIPDRITGYAKSTCLKAAFVRIVFPAATVMRKTTEKIAMEFSAIWPTKELLSPFCLGIVSLDRG